jgi:hypothetical protein
MAKDVHSALHTIVEKQGNMSSAAAEEYVQSLKEQHRYTAMSTKGIFAFTKDFRAPSSRPRAATGLRVPARRWDARMPDTPIFELLKMNSGLPLF